MKRYTFTLFMILIFGLKMIAQTESYTALKVTGTNVPVMDGTIDKIWENVQIVPLTKVPEKDGAVHPNITVQNPDPSDYYAEFGMLWNDTGMFFLFRVVDDKIVIEDDNSTLSARPADQWWTDDNINLLFSKDLVNASFTQWEFAWQPGIDQEEKLSSDEWLNAAVIDISLVQSKWNQDGTTWTLETFINWKSFCDGNPTITPGQIIYLEARARDDDDSDSWESMFQWSTTNYNIESDGVGFGSVTLSTTEVEATAISVRNSITSKIYPNPVSDMLSVDFGQSYNANVSISIYNLNGKLVKSYNSFGDQTIDININDLIKGIYILEFKSETINEKKCFIKQ